MPIEPAGRAAKLRQRVVIDTNVWISAWLSAQGAPAQVVRRAVLAADVVFTDQTFDELNTRIWRPKFDRYLSLERRQQLLHDAAAIGHWVKVPAEISSKTFCRDPDDDKLIHAALAAEAQWIISGDQDMLAVAGALRVQGIHVCTPADGLTLGP